MSPPEIGVEVRFDSEDAARSKLSVKSVSGTATIRSSALARTVEFDVDSDLLTIAAVQSSKKLTSDQISVGAIAEGSSVFTLVDTDADGRLSLRERQQIARKLRALDRDKDQQISPGEIPQVTRLAIGLGPVVHKHLARRQSLSTRPESTAAPAWFVRMDTNGDLDVSPREFLGTPQQFNALDQNGDELISQEEALDGTAKADPE